MSAPVSRSPRWGSATETAVAGDDDRYHKVAAPPKPLDVVRASARAGEADAVRTEYVAEALAREALLAALRVPDKFSEFEDRDRLERAWEGGAFP